MSEKPMELLGIPVIRRNPPLNQEEVTILCGSRAEVIPMEITQVAPGQFVGSIVSVTTMESMRSHIQELLRENGELRRRLAIYEPEAPC